MKNKNFDTLLRRTVKIRSPDANIQDSFLKRAMFRIEPTTLYSSVLTKRLENKPRWSYTTVWTSLGEKNMIQKHQE